MGPCRWTGNVMGCDEQDFLLPATAVAIGLDGIAVLTKFLSILFRLLVKKDPLKSFSSGQNLSGLIVLVANLCSLIAFCLRLAPPGGLPFLFAQLFWGLGCSCSIFGGQNYLLAIIELTEGSKTLSHSTLFTRSQKMVYFSPCFLCITSSVVLYSVSGAYTILGNDEVALPIFRAACLVVACCVTLAIIFLLKSAFDFIVTINKTLREIELMSQYGKQESESLALVIRRTQSTCIHSFFMAFLLALCFFVLGIDEGLFSNPSFSKGIYVLFVLKCLIESIMFSLILLVEVKVFRNQSNTTAPNKSSTIKESEMCVS